MRGGLVCVFLLSACGGDDHGGRQDADPDPDAGIPADAGPPDECALGTDDCDPAATCTDLPDGFECACEGAFVGDGRTCTGRYSAIEAGDGHACAIRVDGTLWCWGTSGYGQVGQVIIGGAASPSQVGSEDDWIAVSAGGQHTCGIRSPGTLWCWGNGRSGQLGSDVSESPAPLRVGTDEDWIAVSAGDQHTCGIRSDQTLRCWGYNGSGQLGSAIASTHVPTLIAPTNFEGDDLWTHVTAGSHHACAIRTDGELFCWGSNQSLQLGIGWIPSAGENRPRAVAGFGWSSVAAGEIHTCGVHTGFGDGEIRCWGSDADGQVGGHEDSETVLQGTPLSVGGGDWSAVTTGWRSTCALKMDGTRWCWGKNDLGQLGDETQTARPAPSPAAGAPWLALSAGGQFMCGIDGDSFVSCWGANMDYDGVGALGDGRARWQVNELELVDDGGGWSSVSSGIMACGLRDEGSLWCWGIPERGGVGDGVEVWRSTPTAVGGSGWDQVSVTFRAACGIRNGELYCWGFDWDGILGVDGEVVVTTPQRVGDASDWQSIAVGVSSACGIRGAEETLWCWGRAPGGEVTTAPAQVAAGLPEAEGWTAVAPNYRHVCGIRASRLYCWGDLVEPASDQPVRIGAAEGWTQVGAAAGYACAIRTGQLYCWGQFADAAGEGIDDVPDPKRVGVLGDWSVVALGSNFEGCGVRSGGELSCWSDGRFPAPVEVGAGRSWLPLVSPGVWGTMAIDTQGRRWFRGDPRVAGDGSMWRTSPALIDD